jgi:hypothetical protein
MDRKSLYLRERERERKREKRVGLNKEIKRIHLLFAFNFLLSILFPLGILFTFVTLHFELFQRMCEGLCHILNQGATGNLK